jgi:hypothetical protein
MGFKERSQPKGGRERHDGVGHEYLPGVYRHHFLWRAHFLGEGVILSAPARTAGRLLVAFPWRTV